MCKNMKKAFMVKVEPVAVLKNNVNCHKVR